MRLFELTIDDENVDEVFAISMVSQPAIEIHGTYFNKDKVLFREIKEEGLFLAPILVPNKKILRVDAQGVPYSVYFAPETIKRLSQMYLEKKYQDKVTLEHEEDVDGVTMVESWIVESVEKDKSKLYNLTVPQGTWMGTFKIDNPEMKEKFRNGEVSAVSIEGIFQHLEKSTPDEKKSAALWESFADYMDRDTDEFTEVEATEFLSKLKGLIQNAEPTITDSSYPGEAAESGSYIAPATLAENEIDIFGYGTKQFYICPGAIGTFEEVKSLVKDEDTIGMVRSAAQIADNVFKIEKDAIEKQSTTQREVDEATVLVADFKDLMGEIEEEVGKTFDVSYMDGHIVTIKSFL